MGTRINLSIYSYSCLHKIVSHLRTEFNSDLKKLRLNNDVDRIGSGGDRIVGKHVHFAVRIDLAEKSIDYQFIEEDLSNKSPLLLKHNPIYKKIPVMIHKGKPICESLIIVQYIHETWREGYPLLPTDPYLKSQAAFWADYIDKHIYSGARKFLMSKGEERQKGVEEFLGYLKVLENELEEKPYFNGESFGFVDMALICYYSHLIAFGKIGDFSVVKDTPKLFAWAKQCLKRESVSKALADPNKIHESLIVFRKRNGIED